MAKRKVAWLIGAVCFIKLVLFATILISNHWAEGNGNHFGVLKYCADNETSCQKVTDKHQTIKGHLNGTLGSIVVSMILTFIWLIISLILFVERLEIPMRTHKIYHSISATILVIADVVTLAAFASGAFKLLEVYYLGWAFYCAVALPILTVCFFFLFWMSTIKSCREFCCTQFDLE